MKRRATSLDPPGNDDGFTLLELLVVLGIISLVLVSVVAFRAPRPGNFALKASAHEIAAHLRAARASAIQRNAERVFWLNMTKGKFWSEPANKKRSLPPGVKTTLVTAQSEIFNGDLASIRFFPDGSSTGGAVVLDRTGRGYAITTDWLTGQIRVSEHVGPIKLK